MVFWAPLKCLVKELVIPCVIIKSEKDKWKRWKSKR